MIGGPHPSRAALYWHYADLELRFDVEIGMALAFHGESSAAAADGLVEHPWFPVQGIWNTRLYFE